MIFNLTACVSELGRGEAGRRGAGLQTRCVQSPGLAHITGAFFSSYAVKVGGFVGATETSAVYACANAFDSSRVVPTGPVTVPPHVWQPIILYLGLPA